MLLNLSKIAFILLAQYCSETSQTIADDKRPNIVIIITDDMGFSDIGCYGGEIQTPNIDSLARQGMKCSQFYNCGKCEPTRAALITGHQFWTHDPNVAIRKDSPNFGEVVQATGYRTMMVGKWHAADIPFERGFHRHFGFMGGGTDSFLGDKSFTLDGKPWPVPKEGFYATTALTKYADQFIREEHEKHSDKPFFLYLAYNAPHSPIEAPADQVTRYRGKYLKGWDIVRKERFEKQQAIGLAGPSWHLPERPKNIPAWDSLDAKSKDFEDLRMATYAAMVDCVDQGVGRIMRTLDELKLSDNTLVMFLNDNGASPNDRVRRGAFGTAGTTWNTGVAWANVSNTPMKFYKRTQHGGGVSTPFIARWPAAFKPRADFSDQPLHVTDILPTVMDVAGIEYPRNFGGKEHPPLPGRSFAPILRNNEMMPSRTLYFSLFNNMAVVDGGWRMVTAYDQPWQLYDLTKDRTEMNDLANSNPHRLQAMLALQKAYQERSDVRLRLNSGEREPEYAPIYKADGTIGPGAKEDVDNPDASLAAAKKRSQGIQLREGDEATTEKPIEKSNSTQTKGKKRKKNSSS